MLPPYVFVTTAGPQSLHLRGQRETPSLPHRAVVYRATRILAQGKVSSQGLPSSSQVLPRPLPGRGLPPLPQCQSHLVGFNIIPNQRSKPDTPARISEGGARNHVVEASRRASCAAAEMQGSPAALSSWFH